MRWKRSGSKELQHEEPGSQERSLRGGAWYVDPYGKAAERWWDGQRWTQEVRAIPTPEDARTIQRARWADGSAARTVRGQTQAERESGRSPGRPEQLEGPADFFVSLTALVGEELRLRQSPLGDWELVRREQRVGGLRLFGPGELARMACRDGTWSVKKRSKNGWELVIESLDGQHIGWYSGHHWLPGGAIILANGDRVDLRRSLDLGWNVRVTRTREPVVRLSRYRLSGMTLSLTIGSL